MTNKTAKLLHEAEKLSPMEKAELIEMLLNSFRAKKRKEIDKTWADEAESRLDAYERGEIDSLPASKVFEEIEHWKM